MKKIFSAKKDEILRPKNLNKKYSDFTKKYSIKYLDNFIQS